MAADGRYPGHHVTAHADPQGQGKLKLDARGCLRGKGVDERRDASRFPATRDNREDDTSPALAPTMDKKNNTGQLSGIWLGLWASATGVAAQSASMSINTFTVNTSKLPFFAALSTPFATFCAKSTTCDVQVFF